MDAGNRRRHDGIGLWSGFWFGVRESLLEVERAHLAHLLMEVEQMSERRDKRDQEAKEGETESVSEKQTEEICVQRTLHKPFCFCHFLQIT